MPSLGFEEENDARPHYSDCQDIKRSLAFYVAALKPLNIKFFMPYKGEDGHPDLWGFWGRQEGVLLAKTREA